MTKRKFDRFMVANNNGRNLKLSRFSDAQFRAFIQGVLPIASEATPRGAFMVGKKPATAADIVFMAPRVSLRTARSTVDLLHELGMLEFDEALGGEWVHDFDVFNPAPKLDTTNAERQARWRERNADVTPTRNGVTTSNVTPLLTPTEVEEEVEVEEEAPLPPEGEQPVTLVAPVKPKTDRKRDIAEWQASFDAWTTENFPGCEPTGVYQLTAWVRSRGIDPTPDAVREFAESAPNFAHLLEPAA